MKALPTLVIAALSVAPFWLLASDIGSDEILKSSVSATIVGIGLAIQAITKLNVD